MGEPLRKSMCATCPFRPGSKYAYLQASLVPTVLGTSRICHSTGKNNAIRKKTGKEPHLCRGARDLQLKIMTSLSFIKAPTDEAWNEMCEQQGIPLVVIKEP